MALKKAIRQDDGVVTNYHRIIYVDAVINSHISIAVKSYIDEAVRTEEQMSEGPFYPYCTAVTYETDYVENMTIEQAYEYLKSLPAFEGAEDA